MPIVRRHLLAAALAALVSAACGRDATPPGDAARSATPVTLAMENAPNPPRTGVNTITVAVTRGGMPVTDAQVSGDFFMPVMESMGKTTVAFMHTGNGRYTGQGSLTMGGSWQVAVTARRGADVLAMRTFNLTTKE